MGTKTRFEEEAKGNSEMAYFQIADTCTHCVPIVFSDLAVDSESKIIIFTSGPLQGFRLYSFFR